MANDMSTSIPIRYPDADRTASVRALDAHAATGQHELAIDTIATRS